MDETLRNLKQNGDKEVLGEDLVKTKEKIFCVTLCIDKIDNYFHCTNNLF